MTSPPMRRHRPVRSPRASRRRLLGPAHRTSRSDWVAGNVDSPLGPVIHEPVTQTLATPWHLVHWLSAGLPDFPKPATHRSDRVALVTCSSAEVCSSAGRCVKKLPQFRSLLVGAHSEQTQVSTVRTLRRLATIGPVPVETTDRSGLAPGLLRNSEPRFPSGRVDVPRLPWHSNTPLRLRCRWVEMPAIGETARLHPVLRTACRGKPAPVTIRETCALAVPPVLSLRLNDHRSASLWRCLNQTETDDRRSRSGHRYRDRQA